MIITRGYGGRPASAEGAGFGEIELSLETEGVAVEVFVKNNALDILLEENDVVIGLEKECAFELELNKNSDLEIEVCNER